MAEPVAQFNLSVHRKIFLHGDPQTVEHLRRLLKPFYFIAPRTGLDMPTTVDEPHFVAYALDMSDQWSLVEVARLFRNCDAASCHKVIFAMRPESPREDHLLFAQEIGARFVAFGRDREQEFKDYLKRVCVEAHHIGSLDHLEQEIDEAARRRDVERLERVIDKLLELPERGESVLRLLVLACQGYGNLKRAEAYLRQMLRLNEQNLWAANELGKLYLRSGRIAQGIEVLQRLSLFHDLNCERILTLSDAYAKVGMGKDAEAVLERGKELGAMDDPRFKDGMAKAKLAQGDLASALAIVEDRGFSDDVISFLNMRAIMAIRSGNLTEGLNYYDQALRGAPEVKLVKAKLYFNMGLAYARGQDLAAAKRCLNESLRLGGQKFRRAEGPLAVIKGIESRQPVDTPRPADGAASSQPDGLMSDWEFETVC